MIDLIIYGAGDVGRFVAHNPDLFHERYRMIAFVDDDPARAGIRVCGLPVWSRERLEATPLKGVAVLVAVAEPEARERITAELTDRGAVFPALIARNAWLSAGVTVGPGTIIYPGCTVEHETAIGRGVILNALCSVGHNVEIGPFATISPGVHLAGRTRIGRGAFLGIGCCTLPGVRIGERAIIGGQAMVTTDIEPGKTATGVPAKPR